MASRIWLKKAGLAGSRLQTTKRIGVKPGFLLSRAEAALATGWRTFNPPRIARQRARRNEREVRRGEMPSIATEEKQPYAPRSSQVV